MAQDLEFIEPPSRQERQEKKKKTMDKKTQKSLVRAFHLGDLWLFSFFFSFLPWRSWRLGGSILLPH